jgi:hypothetical protein
MGEKGLAWVDREWRWDLAAARLSAILTPLRRLSPQPPPKPASAPAKAPPSR